MPMQPKVFELGQWTPDAPELSADGVVGGAQLRADAVWLRSSR